MKKLALIFALILISPLSFANSGQATGPLLGVGVADFDDDNNAGTAALSNYAWLQFKTSDVNFDGDADNDSNDYTTECHQGYFYPVWFDISTPKGEAAYKTALSAVPAGSTIVVSYTQNGAGICVVDQLFIVSP